MGYSPGRTRLGIVGLGAALALTSTLVGAGPVGAQEEEPPPGIVPEEGDWTQPQIDWMVDQVEWVESVLPENFPTSYTGDGPELQAMGYTNFGATTPGLYDHWDNQDMVTDEHILNPNYPESLVYQYVGGGEWELKAAMFKLDFETELDEIPSMLSWIPGWHGHPELCAAPDGTFAGVTDPEAPDCPEGTRHMDTPVMAHVWLEDPGCGHRFGGVGGDGLHCDVVHHSE